jgi:hypothetical protein
VAHRHQAVLAVLAHLPHQSRDHRRGAEQQHPFGTESVGHDPAREPAQGRDQDEAARHEENDLQGRQMLDRPQPVGQPETQAAHREGVEQVREIVERRVADPLHIALVEPIATEQKQPERQRHEHDPRVGDRRTSAGHDREGGGDRDADCIGACQRPPHEVVTAGIARLDRALPGAPFRAERARNPECRRGGRCE